MGSIGLRFKLKKMFHIEFEDLSKASVSGQFCHLWPLITKLTSKSTLFNSLEMSFTCIVH